MKTSHGHLRRVGLLLLIACVLCSTLALTSCKKKQLNYLEADLSKYLLLPENKYLGHPIAIEMDEVSEMDLQNALLQTRAKYKNKTAENGGAYLFDRVLSAGDVVYLFYTPYYLDDNGARIDCYNSGTSNLATSSGASPVNRTPYELELGSGVFGAGFELGLVGKNPKEYAKFDYADLGSIKSDDTLFITYTALRTTESDVYEENVTACVRPDDTNIEARYGVGFWETVTSYEIGTTHNNLELPLPVGENEKIAYTSIKVDFVRHASEIPTLTVEVRFPASYDYELFAGRTVYFECFVQKCVAYTEAEINEDLIKNTIGLTDEDLAPYEGTAVEKYEGYLRNRLEEDRKAEAVAEAESKMWDYLKDVAEIRSFPKKEVDRIYDSNCERLEEYYEPYKSQYESFDLFAVDYLGLEAGSDWKAHILSETEEEVKERLILYTIMRAQNFVPSEEQLQKCYDDFFNELIDMYAERWGIQRAQYTTDEEYNAARENVKKEIVDYYGDEYFVESAYYQFAGNRVLSLFNVTLNGEALEIPVK